MIVPPKRSVLIVTTAAPNQTTCNTPKHMRVPALLLLLLGCRLEIKQEQTEEGCFVAYKKNRDKDEWLLFIWS